MDLLLLFKFVLDEILICIFSSQVQITFRPVIDVTLDAQECSTIPPAIRSY